MAPQDNKKTALVVGAVVATILLGGVIGQVAAAAAADPAEDLAPPSESPIELDPEAGSDELGSVEGMRLGRW